MFLFEVCEWQYIIKNKIKPCMEDTFSICHSLIACLRAHKSEDDEKAIDGERCMCHKRKTAFN